MKKKLILLFFAVLLIAACSKVSLFKSNSKMDQLNTSSTKNFISMLGATFKAVKMTYPNLYWKKLVDPDNKKSDFSEEYLAALNLGSQLVDIGVAAYGKDWKTVNTISESIKTLSEKLGIKSSLEEQAVLLKEAIDKNDEKETIKLIDEIKSIAEQNLDSLYKQDISSLIKCGAWITINNKILNIINSYYSSTACDTLLRVKSDVDVVQGSLVNIQDEKISNSVQIKKSINYIRVFSSVINYPVINGRYSNVISKNNIENLTALSNDVVNSFKK